MNKIFFIFKHKIILLLFIIHPFFVLSAYTQTNKTKQILQYTTPQTVELSTLTSKLTTNLTYIKYLKNKGYITVGMLEKDQYPFFYSNNKGEFMGLDVTIAQTIANNLNINLVINRDAQAFNDLIPLLLDNKVDIIISKLSRTIARAETVIFTKPYANFRQAMLFNRIQLTKVSSSDNDTAMLIKKFSGSLGVIKNSSYQRYAKTNFPNAHLVPFGTWEKAIKAVTNGTVLSIYRDELEIQKIITSAPETSIFLKPIVITDKIDPIAIALQPNEYHFAYYLNLFLHNLNIPHTAKDILKAYSLE